MQQQQQHQKQDLPAAVLICAAAIAGVEIKLPVASRSFNTLSDWY